MNPEDIAKPGDNNKPEKPAADPYESTIAETYSQAGVKPKPGDASPATLPTSQVKPGQIIFQAPSLNKPGTQPKSVWDKKSENAKPEQQAAPPPIDDSLFEGPKAPLPKPIVEKPPVSRPVESPPDQRPGARLRNIFNKPANPEPTDTQPQQPAPATPRGRLRNFIQGLQQPPPGGDGQPAPQRLLGPDGILRKGLQENGLVDAVKTLMDTKIEHNPADKSVKVTADFVKIMDAVPGQQPDESSRYLRDFLSSVKSISLKEDTLTFELKAEKRIAISNDEAKKNGLKEMKFGDAGPNPSVSLDIKTDPQNPKKAEISKISGISMITDKNKELKVHQLNIDTSTEKPTMTAIVDNPAEQPSYVPDNLWPKTISISIPMEDEQGQPNATAKGVSKALSLYSESKQALSSGDMSGLGKLIPIPGLMDKLNGLFQPQSSPLNNLRNFRP